MDIVQCPGSPVTASGSGKLQRKALEIAMEWHALPVTIIY